MWIYLVVFLVSFLLMRLSEKCNKKSFKIVLVFFALSIPSILAGVRDYTIGTDVSGYLKPMFECATEAKSWKDYYGMYWQESAWLIRYVSGIEIGFSALVYIVTKITGSMQFLMFFIEFIILVFMYRGLSKYKSLEGNISIAMLVYYLLFYNITLNIMRQLISIAICFYAFSCLLNDRNGKLKFFIWYFVAIGFHITSIVGIIIYGIYVLLNTNKKKYIKLSKYSLSVNNIVICILFVLGIVLCLNLKPIILLMSLFGFDYYSAYVDGNIRFSLLSFIELIPIVCIYIINRQTFHKKFDNSFFYVIVFFMNFIISQLSTINKYTQRIGFLFLTFNTIFYVFLINSFGEKNMRAVIRVILIIYLLLYWIYNFVIGGRGETVPYKFVF